MKKKIIGHKTQKQKLWSLLKSNRIPQAMIFSGVAGIGKRSLALSFLSAIICSSEKKPCGECTSCRQIEDGIFPDLLVLLPDEKGSIAIGDSDKREYGSVRWLISRLAQKSIGERYVVIIDGFDCLTDAAQNALLKTIEEPSKGVCIIMIASSSSNIINTILSRSMHIKFNPLTESEIISLIDNNKESSEIEFVAAASGGSLHYAGLVLEESFRLDVLRICEAISFSVRLGKPFDIEELKLPVGKKSLDLIAIMINIFEYNLRMVLAKTDNYSSYIEKLYIDDVEVLHKIIKALLIVRNIASRNINSEFAIKGAVYAIYEKYFDAPQFNKLNVC